ncbi:MAG: hypothetical protein R6U21_04635 [Thermoplasmatota archaeon]
MFRFLKQDNKAIMGLTLSQIGIMIASAVILAALFSILFDSTWQEKQKMQQITQQISSSLVSIDNTWYETQKNIAVSKEYFGYNITISSSSIEVSTSGLDEHFIRKPLIVLPVMRTCSDEWITAEQLHSYLYQQYGHQGTKEDPIPENSGVYRYIENETNNSYFTYSLQPYVIDTSLQITLEKILIYIDENQDGIWQKTENILDYVVLYQCTE